MSANTDRNAAQKRIDQLTEELKEHNYLYYVLAQPVIPDYEFDLLLRELQDLEEAFPDLRRADSPTLRVGGEITKEFPSFQHLRPMLSLQNTYSREEVDDFDKSIRKLLDGQPFSYIVQHKFDGVSLSLHYQNGLLQHGTTRGDGVQGDEITANVKTIRTIPIRVRGEAMAEFEVRGEVVMHKSDFEKLNEKRVANGEAPFMNPRNSTAGTLKMQDSAIVASRPLTFFAYQLEAEEGMPNTDWERQMALRDMGFQIDSNCQQCKDVDAVFEFINSWEQKRHELNFDIDGVVIKVNEVELREILGRTSKFPRWAIAYKYQSEQAETQLKFINYQVGRTGMVTPVANLVPVLLAGTTVKRASLYNADNLEKLDIREGDYVKVEKGGEIIPKVVEVVVSKRPAGLKPTEFLKNCPECNTPLIKNEGEVDFYCPNHATCPPQVRGRIEHFASRRAMDIDGLGEQIIAQLVECGLIKDFTDLYDLSYEQLINLERFADKSVRNLLEGIKKSAEVPFPRVLYAIGIRFIGETVAKKLAKRFKSMDALMEAELETISEIHEIGERIAHSVREFFDQEKNRERIARLKAAGLQMEVGEEDKAVSNALEGKSFVVTGTLENFTRDTIKAHIESHGGQVKGSVTAKVDFVLAGADPGGSKISKAEQLKVRVITEAEYQEMVS
ncbi:MAG: NAD-dependent DNA ligase LigA [Bacteroidia bacterium]|nr:NAD-dependent DNA ligase LigA [Bacteroidia bacterium]